MYLFIVCAVICLMCFISCMNYLMYSCTVDLFLRIISFTCLFRFPLLLKFNSFTCCLFVWLIIYVYYHVYYSLDWTLCSHIFIIIHIHPHFSTSFLRCVCLCGYTSLAVSNMPSTLPVMLKGFVYVLRHRGVGCLWDGLRSSTHGTKTKDPDDPSLCFFFKSRTWTLQNEATRNGHETAIKPSRLSNSTSILGSWCRGAAYVLHHHFLFSWIGSKKKTPSLPTCHESRGYFSFETPKIRNMIQRSWWNWIDWLN